MIKINGILGITNGDRPFLDFSDKKGTYANGVEYFLIKGMLVISTEKIVTEEGDEGLLKAAEEGKLDIWPLTTFHNWDNIGLLKQRLIRKIDETKKIKIFSDKVKELDSRYPSVPNDLRQTVYSLDWYYQYTDDGNVYRRAEEWHDKTFKKLKEIGMESYYTEYKKIVMK